MTDRELEALAHRGFRYALALCGERAVAEDLLQDAWASVLTAQGRLDAGYLLRAIRSRWVDRWRRDERVAFVPFEPTTADPASDPREIDARALREAFATLRDEEREVLLLNVVEGYSASEVGALLDRPRNTVLTQLSRGRTRLRAWFARNDREAL